MDQSGLPILYTFRRCPYAMRARVALYISGIQCELREVVLRDKPEHMLEISPSATVPVLQASASHIIDESLDVMVWALEQNDPNSWMVPESSGYDAMMELIIEADGEFKNNLDRYKYPNRYDNVDAISFRTAGERFLAKLETRLQETTYLYGNRLCLADMAIAPFIRQFANVDRGWFDQTGYPALRYWLEEFLSSQTFNAIMEKYPQWRPDDMIMMTPVADG